MLVPLVSERLLLRDFMVDDWPAVQAYASRPEVYRFQPWGPSTPDDARGYIEQAIAQVRMQPRTEYTLAIVLRATNVVIGASTLMIQRQQARQGELGYFLHPDFWGHGYATEVAYRLLQFGFITLRLQRIVATCDPRNTASVRVLEKIGMQYEGRLHKHMLLRDGWRDSLVYSVRDHEWMAAQHEHDRD